MYAIRSYYAGSGIYREVKLVTHAPVHLQRHGLAVATRGNREVDSYNFV